MSPFQQRLCGFMFTVWLVAGVLICASCWKYLNELCVPDTETDEAAVVIR
jgi:hypothetical protein